MLAVHEHTPVELDTLPDIDHGGLRRRAYTAAAASGIVAIMLMWWFRSLAGELTLYDRISYPLLIATCSWILRALWHGRRSLMTIGRIGFVVFALYHFGNLIFSFPDASSPTDVRLALGETHYWNMAVAFMLAFLLYETRRSVLLSFGVFGMTVVLTWIQLYRTLGLDYQPGFVAGVVKLQISSGMLLVLVYAFGYMKDRLTRAENTARNMALLANTDPLTSSANRRSLYTDLVEEAQRASRYARPLSVILFDIDSFKQINDTQGHPVGDTVLIEVARLVERRIRAIDKFGRWGGEEFLVICPETEYDAAVDVAERLRDAIERHRFGSVGRVTASFGIAALRPGESVDQLLQRADQSLYRAKRSGKNRVDQVG